MSLPRARPHWGGMGSLRRSPRRSSGCARMPPPLSPGTPWSWMVAAMPVNSQFPYLFSPIKVGPVTLPNRILWLPHSTGYTTDGVIGDRYIAYLAERARGGTGAIVTGQQLVHMTSAHRLNEAFGFDEKVVPMYRRLADAVHEHGSKLFFQIGHVGKQTDSSLSRRPLFAPSAIAGPVSKEVPWEMEPEDIADVVRGFGLVAKHAREGGADGVEIHGSSGYLIQQFMSPLSNHRTDEYGGPLENRVRFAMEVVEAVRENAGPGLAVGIRLCGDEFMDGGSTLEEMAEISSLLASTGKIDYISLSLGHYASFRSSFPLGTGMPLGPFVYHGARIKEAVDIPVVVSGRIIDPMQAEQVLSSGHADLVGMCRALICDPDFASKSASGRLEDIRMCISCNQGCLDRSARSKPIACIQNAAVGYEREMGPHTLKPVGMRKKVLVAGGGPAGMEAARVAALRGHEVHLYEKSTELGGQVNLAARIPSREEFGGIVRFLSRQMDRMGVHVHLGIEVIPELVALQAPDTVIVATGSCPSKLPVPGAEQDNVLSSWDVISGLKPLGDGVLLVDDEGHYQGASLAVFLAEQGRRLEIVTRLPFFAMELAASWGLPPVYHKVLSRNVAITPFTAVRRIDGRSVTLYNVFSGAESQRHGVDTIVTVIGNRADNKLYKSLRGQVKELYAAGDCAAPRLVMDAIYDASRIARLV